METVLPQIEDEVHHALQKHPVGDLMEDFTNQGEFLALENFLPQHVIDSFIEEVQQIRTLMNRNYVPGHKKGGSISYYLLRQSAPSLLAFYRDPRLIEWFSQLAGAKLLLCPEDDPHACALYFYTEAGDHIGYHYDTSFYKGARYTALLGLVDRSTSRLVCRLHTKNSVAKPQELSLTTDPGLLIFFNGDKLYHAVTPLGENEERIVLTMQYVTNPEMGTFKRWYSNLKDAVGYFGWSGLFRRAPHLKKPT
jgi:hypothetical protein